MSVPGFNPFNVDGINADAEVMRQFLQRVFQSAPPGSVLADPARREKLFAAVGSVVELTVSLTIGQRFVPEALQKTFAILVSGVEKQPGTGRLPIGKVPGGNFLPSPFGFLDPTSIGLERNFYIPSTRPERISAVDLLPRAVDRIGLGIPEQRAQEARELQSLRDVQDRTAAQLVATESTAGLELIVGPTYAFQRGQRIAVASNVPLPALQQAARAELNRRAAFDTNPLTPLVADVANSVTAFRDEVALILEETRELTADLDRQQAALLAAVRDPRDPTEQLLSGVRGAVGRVDEPEFVGNLQREAARRAPKPERFVPGDRADP